MYFFFGGGGGGGEGGGSATACRLISFHFGEYQEKWPLPVVISEAEK